MTDEELEAIEREAKDRIDFIQRQFGDGIKLFPPSDRDFEIVSLVAELRKTREENERFKKALEEISKDKKFGDTSNEKLNDRYTPAMHIASYFQMMAREALAKDNRDQGRSICIHGSSEPLLCKECKK